jgi:hypothetical protein
VEEDNSFSLLKFVKKTKHFLKPFSIFWKNQSYYRNKQYLKKSSEPQLLGARKTWAWHYQEDNMPTHRKKHISFFCSNENGRCLVKRSPIVNSWMSSFVFSTFYIKNTKNWNNLSIGIRVIILVVFRTVSQQLNFRLDWWLSSARFKYKPGYRSCDLLKIWVLWLVDFFFFKKILYKICSPISML